MCLAGCPGHSEPAAGSANLGPGCLFTWASSCTIDTVSFPLSHPKCPAHRLCTWWINERRMNEIPKAELLHDWFCDTFTIPIWLASLKDSLLTSVSLLTASLLLESSPASMYCFINYLSLSLVLICFLSFFVLRNCLVLKTNRKEKEKILEIYSIFC